MMAITKNSESSKRCQGCRDTRILLHCQWRYKTVRLLWKTVQWFLKKLNIELPFDSAIQLLVIYPKELKAICMVVLFTIAKRWIQTPCPSVEEWYIHTVEYFLALKRKEVLSTCFYMAETFFFNFYFILQYSSQCCVSGVQHSDSVIHLHVSILFQILFPFRLLQNIEQRSLCYTVGPCWLSILNIVVCVC